MISDLRLYVMDIDDIKDGVLLNRQHMSLELAGSMRSD